MAVDGSVFSASLETESKPEKSSFTFSSQGKICEFETNSSHLKNQIGPSTKVSSLLYLVSKQYVHWIIVAMVDF